MYRHLQPKCNHGQVLSPWGRPNTLCKYINCGTSCDSRTVKFNLTLVFFHEHCSELLFGCPLIEHYLPRSYRLLSKIHINEHELHKGQENSR